MKKPTLKRFKEALERAGGNLTNTAAALGCDRSTVWAWSKNDEAFAMAIENSRKKILDRCISTSQILAFGIPEKDEHGNVVGWRERPDAGMLRYFMSTLGRKEGFGESLDITTNGNAIKFPIISDKDLQDFIREQSENK